MELREYLIPLRKWWLLIVTATLLAAVSAFLATQFQVSQYRTKATLMLGQAISNPNPTGLEFYTVQQLAGTYADIAMRRPVREATMESLGLTWLPEYSARLVPNTQLLEITVIDTVPERAQAIANVLAEQLVLQSPTGRTDPQRQEFIDSQLDQLEGDISATEAELSRLQSELGAMISARQIADAQTEIASLRTKLTTLQANYAGLLTNTEQGALNTLRVIEPAVVPSAPINDNTVATVLLGAAIGFVLSAGAAYLMEYLDDSLKTPEEISAVMEAPIIGFIAATDANGDAKHYAVVAESPRSAVAEAFRTLRTNLEFAGVDRPLRTILVTSPSPGDGKTTIATNLAVIMAQGDKRVVLLDADLRRPRVHRYANVSNSFGLSDVFRDKMELSEATQSWDASENLTVITSGSLPPNPAELLNSSRMGEILEELSEEADVVIIDSPPVLVTDASILAAKVDGVLIVVEPGRTNEVAAKALTEQMERADARVVGVVLNRIPRRPGYYYGGYKYYYAPNYYQNGSTNLSKVDQQNGHRNGSGGQRRGMRKLFAGRKEKAESD
jgi:capsular exopolysaccharide synthesis family protein